jgi:DNA-directed RNA polymerase specialized sigma subunit
LAGLPKEQRRPIVIELFNQDMTQEKIAEELNISQQTVTSI